MTVIERINMSDFQFFFVLLASSLGLQEPMREERNLSVLFCFIVYEMVLDVLVTEWYLFQFFFVLLISS